MTESAHVRFPALLCFLLFFIWNADTVSLRIILYVTVHLDASPKSRKEAELLSAARPAPLSPPLTDEEKESVKV